MQQNLRMKHAVPDQVRHVRLPAVEPLKPACFSLRQRGRGGDSNFSCSDLFNYDELPTRILNRAYHLLPPIAKVLSKFTSGEVRLMLAQVRVPHEKEPVSHKVQAADDVCNYMVYEFSDNRAFFVN